MQSIINNNNNNYNADSDQPLSLVERITEQATRKRAAEKESKDRVIEAQVTAVLSQAETAVAAQQIIASIQDPETRAKALKVLNDKIAEEAKQRDQDRAQLVTGVIAGDLCVNLVRGKQCTRPAESDPRFGDMCKQCFYAFGRQELSKLSGEERYEEKCKRQERKRERDAQAAKAKERHIRQAQEKRKKMRAKKASSAQQISVRPLQADMVNDQQLLQAAAHRSQPPDTTLKPASLNAAPAQHQAQPDLGNFGTLPDVGFQPAHVPQQQHVQPAVGSAEPMEPDSGKDKNCGGIDLYGGDFQAEIDAILADEELRDANDGDYASGDGSSMDVDEGEEDDDVDEDDEEEDDEEADEHESCTACFEDADSSNSYPCEGCSATIHHYAECIRLHERSCGKTQ